MPSHSGLDQSQQPEHEQHHAEAERGRPTGSESDPPPGALERADRLLQRVVLDVLDDLANRGGLAARDGARRRVRHGAWFYHAERNRTTAAASSSAAANTLEPLAERGRFEHPLSIRRPERRQRSEVVRAQVWVARRSRCRAAASSRRAPRTSSLSARTRSCKVFDRRRAASSRSSRSRSSSGHRSMSASGYGSSGSQALTRSRSCADGCQRVATVGQGADVDARRATVPTRSGRRRHRPRDPRSIITTPNSATSDIVGEDVVHHLAVPGLEHVQRQHRYRAATPSQAGTSASHPSSNTYEICRASTRLELGDVGFARSPGSGRSVSLSASHDRLVDGGIVGAGGVEHEREVERAPVAPRVASRSAP